MVNWQIKASVLFHQMSMIHYNGNALLNIPLIYDDAARDRMDTHVPMKSYLLVHDALKTRDFELLQQDKTFRDILSRTCLCCGKNVTLTGPCQDHVLRHHLQTQHAEPQQAIQCLLQMVIHRRMHDHLTTCDWCGTTIVPTHADNEYDAHLAECPVLLHFVTWLLIPLTAPHGSRAGGRPQSDQRRVGHVGGLRGTKRPQPEEAQESSSVGPTIKEAFARQRKRDPAQDAEPPLPTGAETRSRSELLASPEHLHLVPVHGARQSDAPDASSQCSVEAAEREQSGQPITEAMSDVDIGSDSAAKDQQGEGEQERRSSMDFQLAEQTDSTRCLVAISQMGSHQEGIGCGRQIDQHPNEGDDSTLGATLQDAGKIRSNHSVSCSAEQNQADTCHPLEIGARHEGPSTSCTYGHLGAQQCMAIGAGQTETPSPATIQDGGRAFENH